MNSLSWMLYWVDVFGNFRGFVEVGFFGCLIITGIAVLFYFMSYGDREKYDTDRQVNEVSSKVMKMGRIVLVVLAPLVIFVPSQKTIYAIVASEVGQDVIERGTLTPEFEKARKVLNKKLDEVLKDEKND